MQSIKVWRPWPLMASMMIMMITFGAFISGCDTEDQGSGSSEVEADRPVERFEFESGEQLEQLINRLNYTPEAWQVGIREVPRIYISNLPKRWRDRTSKEIPVETQKQVFFRLLGPLILHANELIQEERQQLQSIIEGLRTGKTLTPSELTFLIETAVAYKVAKKEGEVDIADNSLQDELIQRVDSLPPSLVLAQAAEESGWGTSRFAVEGITSQQQRSEHGDHKIASYETPLQSVIAYMQNLNTHPSYETLRTHRAELRRAGTKVTGWDLAKTLTKYSERGQEYIDSLHALMKTNMLMETDDAHFGDGPTILLTPVGDRE